MNDKSGISIESANLTANIPVRSHSDFRFSFYIRAAGLDQASREQAGKFVRNAFPGFNYSTFGDDATALGLYVADADSPGMCKQLVKIFRAADQPVYAMGAYALNDLREAPHLGESPDVENMPEGLKDFATFKDVLGTLVYAAIKTTPRP